MGHQRISAKEIAWCGSMNADTRRRWVKTFQLLAPGPEFSEFDAVLTAIAATLLEASTSHRAPEAFSALLPRFRRAYLAGKRDLWFVIGANGHEFLFADSASRAASHAAGIKGLAWTISLRAPIDASLARYATLTARAITTDAGIHELHRARGAPA
jgi:hypothetical protein